MSFLKDNFSKKGNLHSYFDIENDKRFRIRQKFNFNEFKYYELYLDSLRGCRFTGFTGDLIISEELNQAIFIGYSSYDKKYDTFNVKDFGPFFKKDKFDFSEELNNFVNLYIIKEYSYKNYFLIKISFLTSYLSNYRKYTVDSIPDKYLIKAINNTLKYKISEHYLLDKDFDNFFIKFIQYNAVSLFKKFYMKSFSDLISLKIRVQNLL